MSFMQQQIVRGNWYEIETADGTWFLPDDLIGELPEFENVSELSEKILKGISQYILSGKPDDIYSIYLLVDQFGARLSAPGYSDCTEWSVFKSEKEAQDYLDEFYGDDEE